MYRLFVFPLKHTVNDLTDAHSQINASYLIKAPLEVYSLYKTPPSNKRPVSNRRPLPRIVSKAEETLQRVRSRNLVSFLLALLTMDYKLDVV